jgi:predicted O-methyltransferase YrrM
MIEFLKKHIKRKYLLAFKKVYDIIFGLVFQLLDIVLLPITIPFSYFFKTSRKRRFANLPLTKGILLKVGVYPIIDHYYEPLFNLKHLKHSLRIDRNLPGIDFNVPKQLEILEQFNYNEELLKFPMDKVDNKIEYCYNHGPFGPGDSEYLYNMIRHFKPGKIIEIGCGSSTLMALNALKKNKENDPAYECEHICIEPYEHAWLKECNVKVVRSLVENVGKELFETLKKDDILFIDSSHIIRPQGDVLFEYLEILPILNSGVIVHIHDIFTPKDYLDEWVKSGTLWNEQYLLEAFLTGNKEFEIIGATNFLSHHYNDQFAAKCPVFKSKVNIEPGSFWIRKKSLI